MQDKNIFVRLGIDVNKQFELKELCGLFKIDLAEQTVRDVTPGCKNKVVSGLYENLLAGKYHLKG